MELPANLVKFLKKNKVYYQVQVHPRTITSSEVARVEHVSGRQVAKVVMVKVQGKDTMLVLPSNRRVDLFKLSTVFGTQDVRIESEKDFKDLFPDCETGAMPAFGKIYGIPCLVDRSLGGEEVIYFNAGNHLETISVRTSDFLRASKAEVCDFSLLWKKEMV